MCSPGQHNEALSRTWFECTSDGKGEMYSPICIYSPHHISTAMNEALAQTAPTAARQSEPKPFTTCPLHNAKKNSFLGLHRADPLGRTGSVFRLQDYRVLQRELYRKKDGLLFSEFWRAKLYYPQSFMWSFYTMQNCLLQNWFYFCFYLSFCFNEQWQIVQGLTVMAIGVLVIVIELNWNEQRPSLIKLIFKYTVDLIK